MRYIGYIYQSAVTSTVVIPSADGNKALIIGECGTPVLVSIQCARQTARDLLSTSFRYGGREIYSAAEVEDLFIVAFNDDRTPHPSEVPGYEDRPHPDLERIGGIY